MQVMRCVREARQTMIAAGGAVEHVDATAPANRRHNDEALRVKNWLPGSYSRLKRSMESAVTHPTGRGIPVLWRMYMSMEASAAFELYSIDWFPRPCLLFICPRSNFVEMLSLLLLLRPCAGTSDRRSNCFGARFTRAPATRLFGWTLFAGANAIG